MSDATNPVPTDNNNDGFDDSQLTQGQSLVPKLDEDNDTPFSPPTDPIADPAAELDVRTQGGQLNQNNQVTDDASDIDAHQLYDEGLAGAAEASEPNAANTVVGYDPAKDQRRQNGDSNTTAAA